MRLRTAFSTRLVIFAIFLLAGGCAPVRARPDATNYLRTVSTAISQSEDTALGKILEPEIRKFPGQSGFRFFENGEASFTARLALIRAANKTLDLQYYAMGNDASSQLMLEALIRAAARGVRVRFLVDSFTVADMDDMLVACDGLKNIEIRVFNPLMTQDQSPMARLRAVFTDLPYANRRMHNKALISDNQAAIVGGRNLSNQYFDEDEEVNFRDVDVLAAGPIVAKISESFDDYWNGPDTFPVDVVYKSAFESREIAKHRAELKKNWDAQLQQPERQMQLVAPFKTVLAQKGMGLTWAKAELASDDPMKVQRPEHWSESIPLKKMLGLLDKANREFIIVSSYFVPQKNGVEWLAGLEERGVEVKVLTNSLASTDVVAVHSGYEPYRKDLIAAGVELYEMMPIDQKKASQRLFGRGQPPMAALHSKVYVIDGEHTIIGSFNLDPRSVELNTEIALVIHSREIAAQMQGMFERSTDPRVSYTLTVDRGKLWWHGLEKGRPRKYDHEPHAGFWRNLQSSLMSLLPEDQL